MLPSGALARPQAPGQLQSLWTAPELLGCRSHVAGRPLPSLPGLLPHSPGWLMAWVALFSRRKKRVCPPAVTSFWPTAPLRGARQGDFMAGHMSTSQQSQMYAHRCSDLTHKDMPSMALLSLWLHLHLLGH